MSEAVAEMVDKATVLKEMASASKLAELQEKRRKSEGWVNGYVAAGAGAGLLGSWVPGLGTASVMALESTMIYQIGRIYKTNFTMGEATATIAVISLATLAGKFISLEAAILLGPFAPLGKGLLAAAIIKAMGGLIIKHFEDCA